MNQERRVVAQELSGPSGRELPAGRIVRRHVPDCKRVIVFDPDRGVLGLTTLARFRRSRRAIEEQFRRFATARER